MKSEEEIVKLLETIRQIAYDVHVYLGNGYLEKVYENTLRNRLRKRGVEVRTQVPLKVYDEDGSVVGDYLADMVVEGCVIVELKAAKMLAAEHYAQTLNYLKTTGLKYALLINFGSYKFEVRRIVSTFDKPCRNGATIEEVATSAADPENSSTRSTSLHGSPDSSQSPSTPLHG